jgi:hypothetical protein
MSVSESYTIRTAQPADAEKISLLYHKVYNGKYSDPLMRDTGLLIKFISNRDTVWIVAEINQEIVCSVVYEVDSANHLAKTFGGVVAPEHRGANLLEKSMTFGSKLLGANPEMAVEVIYATTRTATVAAQMVTKKLGYLQLGIFPNVHRTTLYETHGLVARFNPGTLKKRHTDFLLHPTVEELFEIVRHECKLEPLNIASLEQVEKARAPLTRNLSDYPLEIVDAPKYVIHRFRNLVNAGQIAYHFYPFHEPNLMIASPADEVQVFLHKAPGEQYCTIVALRKPEGLSKQKILEAVCNLLRDIGVRYIETIVRADRLATVNAVINAGFIPCAYFPAFQVHGDNRYDYVVLSRTFEILDFKNIQLEGANKAYLLHYFSKWKSTLLDVL